MTYILRKYKKYDISFNPRKAILHIRKKMLVKDYVQLKQDLIKRNCYVLNIVIGE